MINKKKIIKKAFNTVKKNIMSDSNSSQNKHADTIIRNHVIWSMGAGMIPILIADIFAVSALQIDMIKQMCKVYDVDYQATQGKALVTSLTSSTLARIGARSLVKLIPGLGIFGGIPVAIFAGASTYALGEVFKKHFESGGTILDFDVDRVKKFYQEKFEKGKTIVKDWEKDARKGEEAFADATPAEAKSDIAEDVEAMEIVEDEGLDIIVKLRELGELKEKGILSDEEFQKMKKKLVDEF